MTSNPSYDDKVAIPEEMKQEIIRRRNNCEFLGKIVIEEKGGKTITVECANIVDAVTLRLIFA